MRFSLEESMPMLERTPRVVRSLLQFLPEAWTHRNYGANADGSPTWSAQEIVGHLIWADQTDWLPRARHILEFGDSRPFEAFDRNGQRSLLQGKTIMLSAIIGEMFKHKPGKACVLAHRDELTFQNEDKFKRVNPDLSTSVFDASVKSWNGEVTFAMVQTLSRENNPISCFVLPCSRRISISDH